MVGQRDVTRLEARGLLTSFVNRDEETALFADAGSAHSAVAARSCADRSAGVGKSRIVAEAAARARRQTDAKAATQAEVAPAVLQCSAYHTNTPLHPWRAT